jgi:uncharacterized membrane protein
MLERLVSFGFLIASLAGASRLLRAEPAWGGKRAVSEPNDVESSWMPTVLRVVAAVFLLVLLQFEAYWFFGQFYLPGRAAAMTLVWVAALAVVLTGKTGIAARTAGTVATLLLLCIAIKVFLFDILGFWGLNMANQPGGTLFFAANLVYSGGAWQLESALMRLLDLLPAIAVIVYAWKLSGQSGRPAIPAPLFATAALSLLFVFCSLELNTFLHAYLPDARPGGISILWGLFATAFVLKGILSGIPSLRYSGLALFGIVVFKVFLADMRHLSPLWRIGAFAVLGLVILAAAAIYMRFREKFELGSKNEKPASPDPKTPTPEGAA